MARALVIAARSFIGRCLCDRLLQRSWLVIPTVRNPHPGALSCDLLDPSGIDDLVRREQPDWIFQCAGSTRATDPRTAYQLHVAGTLNLLEAVRRHSPDSGVILMGSAAEYGLTLPENFPVDENHPTIPLSSFGASKLAQTHLGQVAAREWKLRIATVRPFNVIGRGLPAHYFAGAVACQLQRMRDNEESGNFPVANAHATRDFVDVRDVVEALIAIAEKSDLAFKSGSIFNVATGIETSLLDMATELGRLAGGFIPVPSGDGSSRGGAVRSCGDSSRLRRAVGWQARYSWQESLAEMWKDYGSR